MLKFLPEDVDNSTIKIGDDLATECYNLTHSDANLVHPLVEFIHVCLTAMGRSYAFCPPADRQFTMYQNGSWHGSIGGILNGSLDMAVADFRHENTAAMTYFSFPFYVDQQSALHTLELRSLLKSCMALKLIIETREPFQGLFGLLDFVAQNNHTLVVLPWQEVAFKALFHDMEYTQKYGEISMHLAPDNQHLYEDVASNANAAAVLGSSFAYLGAQSSRNLLVLVDRTLRNQYYGLFHSPKLDITERLRFQFVMAVENGIFSRAQKRVEAAAKLPAYRLPNRGMKSLDLHEHRFAFTLISAGIVVGIFTACIETLMNSF